MAKVNHSQTYAPAVPVGMVRRVLHGVAGILMPQACVHCRKEGELMCSACFASMEPVKGPRCVKCGEVVDARSDLCASCTITPPPLDTLAPVYRYNGAARSAVLALKFRALRSVVPIMARPMSMASLALREDVDCVVPVPSHAKRVRERGYNQAALLAAEVAKLTGKLLVQRGLTKTRHTPSQVDLGREERSNSVRGAFDAAYDFAGAHVLLIDDVATTGSTLMACASALKHANAQRVSALTFAKEAQEINAVAE